MLAINLSLIKKDDILVKYCITKNEMEDELENQTSFSLVNETSKKLESLKSSYKAQVNPREINLFYLEHNVRERIEKQGDEYVVLNTALKFKEEEY